MLIPLNLRLYSSTAPLGCFRSDLVTYHYCTIAACLCIQKYLSLSVCR